MNEKKFSKEEQKFWQRYFRIEKLEDIPQEWSILGGYGFGDDQTDEYIYFVSLRVPILREIILKESYVTDEGVKHMSVFEELKLLYLRKHKAITKKSIPYFNEMKSLESLNITKTNITLTDLHELLDNQNLREVFIDSEENEENILEKAFALKERMPNCNIYLDTCFTTENNGDPIDPIF
ncbi:hypothetical protein ATE92_2067 [Ulvibacter sp. MAR_2010_11]|uniref:hypothetical protein n=1 Tax=Ulvibacter sp. MAR_2010_11 TaxID=1250229 RepID=UPI000C2C145D|nr:hypothetical protein [Ulvibacter sp. MAR_2010_11]PKA83898.1 hypothetical protein ATE92_2067 [Ulvibacter sp. MAR_2010_11]